MRQSWMREPVMLPLLLIDEPDKHVREMISDGVHMVWWALTTQNHEHLEISSAKTGRE